MLAFGIRYLNGFSAATEFDNRERAEWPPHPGSVFMALAAAHFQAGAEPEERRALEWLETLDQAPDIKAAAAIQRGVVTHYVTVNDKAGPGTTLLQSAPMTRDRQPRSFARAWLEHDTVVLVWRTAHPDESIQTALRSLCSKVTRIGHSSSLVQMWVVREEQVLEPDWVPDEGRAVMRLRIAMPGTLEELERRYNGHALKTFLTPGTSRRSLGQEDPKAGAEATQRGIFEQDASPAASYSLLYAGVRPAHS